MEILTLSQRRPLELVIPTWSRGAHCQRNVYGDPLRSRSGHSGIKIKAFILVRTDISRNR